MGKVGKFVRDIGDPGGTIIHKATGGKGSRPNNLKSGLNPVAQPTFEPAEPYDPGDRVGASINGQSGVAQMPQRLGWTNNGRQYANSPFNGANPQYYQQPQGPPPQGGPMSMGGSAMGASGPQQMLPSPGQGGSMPPAGAQPPGQPTTQPTSQQQLMIDMLRNGGGPRAM